MEIRGTKGKREGKKIVAPLACPGDRGVNPHRGVVGHKPGEGYGRKGGSQEGQPSGRKLIHPRKGRGSREVSDQERKITKGSKKKKIERGGEGISSLEAVRVSLTVVKQRADAHSGRENQKGDRSHNIATSNKPTVGNPRK